MHACVVHLAWAAGPCHRIHADPHDRQDKHLGSKAANSCAHTPMPSVQPPTRSFGSRPCRCGHASAARCAARPLYSRQNRRDENQCMQTTVILIAPHGALCHAMQAAVGRRPSAPPAVCPSLPHAITGTLAHPARRNRCATAAGLVCAAAPVAPAHTALSRTPITIQNKARQQDMWRSSLRRRLVFTYTHTDAAERLGCCCCYPAGPQESFAPNKPCTHAAAAPQPRFDGKNARAPRSGRVASAAPRTVHARSARLPRRPLPLRPAAQMKRTGRRPGAMTPRFSCQISANAV